MKADAWFREVGAWLREIAGWLLVLLGLLAFYESWRMLRTRWIFESVPMAAIAFVIFRGGIHLLKVAVAARVAQQASRELDEAAVRPRIKKNTPPRIPMSNAPPKISMTNAPPMRHQ